MAKKDINIVSSMVGKGLQLEYDLLKALLNERDCYVNGYHYTHVAGSTFVRADVDLFLEVVMPNVLSLSRENWLVPNSEWWHFANDRFLPQFTKVLCKTRDCERLWRQKLANDRPERVVYTGFDVRDLYDANVPREKKILHLSGESEFKNTEAVIEGWRKAVEQNDLQPFTLTVVTRQKKYRDMCEGLDRTTCLERVPDDELKQVMNSHLIHLMPSKYEGFGHSLHEGLLCGALMITTAAPPMNEFAGVQTEFGVRVVKTSPRSLATLHEVSADGVFDSLKRATLAMSPAAALPHLWAQAEERMRQRLAAVRPAALAERDAFRQKFLELIGA